MTALLLLACAKSSFPISKGCPDVVPDPSLQLPFDSADVAAALSADIVVEPEPDAPTRLELSFRVFPRDDGHVGRITHRSCPSGRMLQFDADVLWSGTVDGHPFMAKQEGARVQAWDADARWVGLDARSLDLRMDPAFTRRFERDHWGDGGLETGRWVVLGPTPGVGALTPFISYNEGHDRLGSFSWRLGPRFRPEERVFQHPPPPSPHP